MGATRYAVWRNANKSAEYATKFTDIFEMTIGDEHSFRYAWAKAYAMTEWSKQARYGEVFASHYVDGRENRELGHQEALDYAKQQADKS